MGKTAILYGSSTGNTSNVAQRIAGKIDSVIVDVLDVAEISATDLKSYRNLIIGTSTWGIGELQDDWDAFLPGLAKEDLSGKNIAFFGLGDSEAYPDTFVDAIGLLYEELKESGADFIGMVDTGNYTFDDSKALLNGEFIGLPLDEDNEDELTETRIDNWLKLLLPNL